MEADVRVRAKACSLPVSYCFALPSASSRLRTLSWPSGRLFCLSRSLFRTRPHKGCLVKLENKKLRFGSRRTLIGRASPLPLEPTRRLRSGLSCCICRLNVELGYFVYPSLMLEKSVACLQYETSAKDSSGEKGATASPTLLLPLLTVPLLLLLLL